MRVLNARFALGLGLFTVVFAIADTAQAGPFRNRRARRAGIVYTSYGYGGGAYGGVAYDAYGQPTYGQPAYGTTTSPCPCPDTAFTAYGGSPAYYPSGAYGTAYGGTYGGAMPMPSAGGTTSYYPPGTVTPSPMPGGTVPAPLPSQDTVAKGDAAAAKTIEINDTGFEPKAMTIEPGTTVKWTNKGQKPHTVTSDKGDWGSGELANGETFSATFTKAGTFDYHCKLHPDMKATITVK